ncbi:hypothetical protein IZU27_09640 [Treponema socranskii]
MLIAEYDYDVDIAVQREEEREIALQEGIVHGEAKGFSAGISEGSYKAKLETAKLMKHTNCKRDFIMQMTGLTKEEVESIS